MEAAIVMQAKSLYLASPAERVRLIRKRIPASHLKELADSMHILQGHLLSILNLPSASVRRKSRQGAMLTTEQAERVVGLECLIGQVAVMVEESGDAIGFDAAQWVGETPADFVETMTGQKLLSGLLARSRAGVFA